MSIYFTGEDGQVINRSKYLRGALRKEGYAVHKKIPPDDSRPSIWFHGLSYNKSILFPDELTPLMNRYKGKLVFFQNDDPSHFDIDKIPESLLDKTHLFLRSHWPTDNKDIQKDLKDRIGFINPLLKPTKAYRGQPLTKRSHTVIFYGTKTGGTNLPGNDNARVYALRQIKKAGIPLKGGLIEHEHYPIPRNFIVSKISQSEHHTLLRESKICLTLWGHTPITYRLFEGLSCRSLVMAQSLSKINFINCGLQPNKHYVELKPDLSDLIDKIEYYLSHITEAQEIADAGYDHFKNNFAFSGVDLPESIYKDIRGTWQGLLDDLSPSKTRAIVFRLISPFIRSL